MFILIFILVPFIFTEIDKVNVLAQINSTVQSKDNINETFMHYVSANQGIGTLHNRLSQGPSELIKYIKLIENSTRQTSTSETSPVQTGTPSEIGITTFPACKSYSIRTQEWVECNVNAKVQSLIDEYDTILTNNLINPLKTLDSKSKQAIGFQDLIKAVHDLEARFNTTLAENPKFWNTVVGKAGLFTELDNQVNDFWKIYDFRINSERTSLENNIAKLKVRFSNLNNSLGELNKEQENIKKRIDEFESPIGKLTAGFNNVITVFPFVLGGGFLVCASILVETIRIRKAYFEFHPMTRGRGRIRAGEVARTAPLWLDPKDENQNKIIRIFVLLLPLIIYFISIGLIYYTWTLSGSSLGVDPYYRTAIKLLYLFFGIVISLISFFYIHREYRNS
jgi:hypothetical protein